MTRVIVNYAMVRSPTSQPVMRDVARLAGVSHQTVSRVLNGHPSVREETRNQVLDAIRELDYRPNTAARTLVTRRSRTLGVVSFDTTLYGPASMLYGIERAARTAGYYVSIASGQGLDSRSVRAGMSRLRDQSVEGIIVIAPIVSAVESLLDKPGGPALVVVGYVGGDLPAVAVDNRAGAARATRYLLGLGHRTVHHVAGPAHWLDAQARVDGWREALEVAGAPVPEPLTGDWTALSGYEAGRRLIGHGEVSAVLCGNDPMALGVMRALREAGRRVPEDVSVVGFDDVPEAAFYAPPLTTVRQDFGTLGRRALELLIEQIDSGARLPTQTLLEPDLVPRDSAVRPR